MKKALLHSEFTKHTLLLVSGTVLANAIPLFLQPFLRRMYTVEEYGALAVFMSLFGMITIIASLRYEATIVLPKQDDESTNIIGLTFLINAAFNALLLIGILLFKSSIAEWIGLSAAYENYLFFLPFTGFLFCLYQSMNQWLIRKKAFKASSINKVVRRTVEGGTQLLMGIWQFPGGLFIGDFLGNIANTISGMKQIVSNGFLRKRLSFEHIRSVAKTYADYPKYSALPTLLSSAATLLPYLFIGKFYGLETLGYVDLSRLVLSIPSIFIAATISQVLYQRITERKHAGLSVTKDLIKVAYLLAGIIIVECVILFSAGDLLFQKVFDENYLQSSHFAKVMIFGFSVSFVTSSFSSVFMTFEKIRQNSLWQIAYFGCVCSLLLFQHLSIIDFLTLFVLIETLMGAINITMISFIVRNYERGLKEVV